MRALGPTEGTAQPSRLQGCKAHPPAKLSPPGSWRSTATASRSSTPPNASGSWPASTFGRIGVTYAALPVILPINYRYVDGSIIFRTAAGAKLEAAACGSVVAFEVDSIDPLTHSGWSVVVTGVASPVTDRDEFDRLEAAAVPRWAPSGDGPVRRAAPPDGLRPAPRAPGSTQR